MIKTLIFDLGGVVLTNDWHDNNKEKFEEFSNFFGVNYEQMEKGWNAAWPDFMIGKIKEDDFWYVFLKVSGSNKIDIEKAKMLWRTYQKPLDNLLQLLPELKINYRLAALTNTSKEWLDFKIEKFGLNDIFEYIVSSGYFGKAKPDQTIYLEITSKLNVKPEKCIFIDDNKDAVLAASTLGMQSILFETDKQLINTLEKP